MGFLRNLFKKKLKAKKPDLPSGDDEEFADAVIVTDVLDLHGFFPEQVPEMVQAFLQNARELRLHSLRIIHGKGKSKLKWVVYKELAKYPEVESFRDAPPQTGGWGATIVYLKTEQENAK